MSKDEDTLGMNCVINRRDFLDGAILTAAGVAMTGFSQSTLAATGEPAAYPPMKMGFRGFNEEAMNAGHAVRDGKNFGSAVDTGELYDLVVVGGGLSGLASAYYYRKQLPSAKILVLESCDDFGGHARRNEFEVNGRQLIACGGSGEIWMPNTYPPEALELLRDIGVNFERSAAHNEADAKNDPMVKYGLGASIFFDKESFGVDRFMPDYPGGIVGWGGRGVPPKQSWTDFYAKAPYKPAVKAGLLRLAIEVKDYLPGVPVADKVVRLKKMTYEEYLRNVMELEPEAVDYLVANSKNVASVGTGPDTISAWYAALFGKPGFGGLGLPAPVESSRMYEPLPDVIFPDGNAGVARLLIRWLIPDALPGKTMEDSLLPRVRYDLLDRPTNDTRVRLSSTVVNVRHLGDPQTAQEVETAYLKDGRVYRVRSRTAVMACFNTILPYIVPSLPDTQKAALQQRVRLPLVVINVAIRNWRALQKLGTSYIYTPGMFCESITAQTAPSMGAYKYPVSPEEPMDLFMWMNEKLLTAPGSGLPPRDRWKVGRAELQAIPFEEFERNIREQLNRVLGPAGFDAKRDIAGITINRWAHGYASATNSLYDPDYTGRADAPWVVGRQRFGRIAIANSDAGAVPLAQSALQQGHRAVADLMNDVVRPVVTIHAPDSDSAADPSNRPVGYHVNGTQERRRGPGFE